MLHAILSGKSGRNSTDIIAGTPWREIYRSSEDLMTSTIFERLQYLPKNRFWEIIFVLFKIATTRENEGIENYELNKIEFWPRWRDVTDIKDTVEPDLFLQFIDTNTNSIFDVIIEAKPYDVGTLQYAEQWFRQIRSYHTVKDGKASRTIFLALGGLTFNLEKGFEQVKKDLSDRFFKKQCSQGRPDTIEIYGASWSGFYKVLEGLKNLSPSESRILEDVKHALKLTGYSRYLSFASMKTYSREITLSLHIKALSFGENNVG